MSAARPCSGSVPLATARFELWIVCDDESTERVEGDEAYKEISRYASGRRAKRKESADEKREAVRDEINIHYPCEP